MWRQLCTQGHSAACTSASVCSSTYEHVQPVHTEACGPTVTGTWNTSDTSCKPCLTWITYKYQISVVSFFKFTDFLMVVLMVLSEFQVMPSEKTVPVKEMSWIRSFSYNIRVSTLQMFLIWSYFAVIVSSKRKEPHYFLFLFLCFERMIICWKLFIQLLHRLTTVPSCFSISFG